MNNVNNNRKRTTWTILPQTHSRMAQNIKHGIVSRLTFSSEPKTCTVNISANQCNSEWHTPHTLIQRRKQINSTPYPPTHSPKCCPPKWSLLSVTAFHQGFHSNGKLTTHVNCTRHHCGGPGMRIQQMTTHVNCTWHHCEDPGMSIQQMTGDQKVQGYKRFGRQPAVGHFLQEDRCQH